METVAKNKEKLDGELRHTKDKKKKQDLEILLKIEQTLNEKKQIRLVEWKATDVILRLFLISSD